MLTHTDEYSSIFFSVCSLSQGIESASGKTMKIKPTHNMHKLCWSNNTRPEKKNPNEKKTTQKKTTNEAIQSRDTQQIEIILIPIIQNWSRESIILYGVCVYHLLVDYCYGHC